MSLTASPPALAPSKVLSGCEPQLLQFADPSPTPHFPGCRSAIMIRQFPSEAYPPPASGSKAALPNSSHSRCLPASVPAPPLSNSTRPGSPAIPKLPTATIMFSAGMRAEPVKPFTPWRQVRSKRYCIHPVRRIKGKVPIPRRQWNCIFPKFSALRTIAGRRLESVRLRNLFRCHLAFCIRQVCLPYRTHGCIHNSISSGSCAVIHAQGELR